MSDSVVVVTGGSQGIGKSLVERLVELEQQVVILDLQASRSSRRILNPSHIVCDVSDEAAVGQAAEVVFREFGAIKALVNNAGWVVNERFSDQTVDTYSKIVAVNFLGVLHTCHHFGPQIRDGGSIVNVSSDAARIGVPKEAAYSGAKGGVVAFSKALAAELGGRGIRVNVVSPGTTLTPLVADALSDEQISRRLRGIPLRRLGEPEDVAEVICTLITGWSYVSGQVISVSGGASRVG